MAVVPQRNPDRTFTWADVVAEAEATRETPLVDRRFDAYEFSQGVRKKQGTGPYDAGQRPDRN